MRFLKFDVPNRPICLRELAQRAYAPLAILAHDRLRVAAAVRFRYGCRLAENKWARRMYIRALRVLSRRAAMQGLQYP